MARSKQITPKSTKGRKQQQQMAPAKKIKKSTKGRKQQQQIAPAKKVKTLASAKKAKAPINQQQLPPDMISDLSDCILIHILSFLEAQEAVQTCILSKRWINVWKKLPTLVVLYYSQFIDGVYEQFVHKLLSLRDDQTDIHSLKLHPPLDKKRNNSLVSHIVKYAFSHNVQHLLLNFTYFKPNCFSFSCPTLKSLKLTSGHSVNSIFPNSLDFPALATLSLTHFTFLPNQDGCARPFSTFNRLNTLILDKCKVLHEQNLCISNTNLENLTIAMYGNTYSGSYFDIELYAPNLITFSFKGNHISKVLGTKSFFPSIKQLTINIRCFDKYKKNYSTLLNWLDTFNNVESLTVDTDTLEVLFNFHNLFKDKSPSLINLKSLKIETYDLITLSQFDEEVDFLLQNSHSANVENIIVDIWSKM
ncbi:putative F-box/LRR-repeat protein At3g18150 [Vicia villosa]|uniref:putative F-box/LRR-repeat protein At3g18150 n=1 Tax=Vicia villosa TaxID=3911 RepID=UPI00273B5FAE|nr:putative F-box/LRR-repeat protein At3g18150 [Vicia villosa]